MASAIAKDSTKVLGKEGAKAVGGALFGASLTESIIFAVNVEDPICWILIVASFCILMFGFKLDFLHSLLWLVPFYLVFAITLSMFFDFVVAKIL